MSISISLAAVILDILSCVERGRMAKGVICHVHCAVAQLDS